MRVGWCGGGLEDGFYFFGVCWPVRFAVVGEGFAVGCDVEVGLGLDGDDDGEVVGLEIDDSGPGGFGV